MCKYVLSRVERFRTMATSFPFQEIHRIPPPMTLWHYIIAEKERFWYPFCFCWTKFFQSQDRHPQTQPYCIILYTFDIKESKRLLLASRERMGTSWPPPVYGGCSFGARQLCFPHSRQFHQTGGQAWLTHSIASPYIEALLLSPIYIWTPGCSLIYV